MSENDLKSHRIIIFQSGYQYVICIGKILHIGIEILISIYKYIDSYHKKYNVIQKNNFQENIIKFS